MMFSTVENSRSINSMSPTFTVFENIYTLFQIIYVLVISLTLTNIDFEILVNVFSQLDICHRILWYYSWNIFFH